METELIGKLRSRYELFFEELDIKENGILGKISNSRCKGQKLRFAGFPYIGSKFSEADKRILFVGLDTGIDECREDDTYHSFDSRRKAIAGNENGCIALGYNPHISGTYAMALFLLKEYYSWEEAWDKLLNSNAGTSEIAINRLTEILPINVLNFVAFTNIYKFVSLCRGCNPVNSKPKCWNEGCLEEEKLKKRSGGCNRRWYNKQEEINMLLDEIRILAPDLVYFQGSASGLNSSIINEIKSLCDICIAHHPSAWNVGANKPNYAHRIQIQKKVSG